MTNSKMIELLRDTDVEWKKLGEVCELKYGKGNTIPKEKGKYPVYGANGIVGSTNEYNNECSSIIGHIGSAGVVKWGEGKHFVTYNGTICRPKNNNINSKYIYHVLLTLNLEDNLKGSQPFLSYGDFDKILIPIPPLKTQEKIVEILDKFTDYVTELTLRQKQYSYFREQLLSENYLNGLKSESDNVLTLTTLGEVAKIKNGKDWKKLGSGEIPVYGSGGIMTYVDTFSYDKPSVLIPRKGSIENIFYVDKPFWNVDTIFHTEIFEDKILPKYLYYFMQQFDLKTLSTDQPDRV